MSSDISSDGFDLFLDNLKKGFNTRYVGRYLGITNVT